MPAITTDDWDERPLWLFSRGEQIAPGISAVRRLGIGQRCESWLARISDGSLVVSKICRPDQVDHPRGSRALQREAEAVVGVHHPGVRRLLEVRLNDPIPGLVFAYAPGHSLSELLDDAVMTVSDCLQLLGHLASVLQVIHETGVAHLDLKPTNLIIGRSPTTPILIDFGSARPLGFDPGPGTPLGSPGYASPELEANQPVTPGMDIYGLGTILYESLTGHEPFDPDLAAADRVLPPPPSQLQTGCPSTIDELVASLLAPHPEGRPSLEELTPRALAHILR